MTENPGRDLTSVADLLPEVLLDQMPEWPPRSKLEPHAEVIRELRKKRRTYSEIAAFFREHLHISVAPSTLHDFVKTRARPAVRDRAAATPEVPVPRPAEGNLEAPVISARAAMSPVSGNDVRERIRALKAQPVATKEEPALFQFDSQAPLTLNPERKEK